VIATMLSGTPTILRSHGLSLEGNVVRKTGGSASAWDTSALFEVPRADNFHVFVEVLEYGEAAADASPALLGIAPIDADLTVEDIEHTTGSFLVLPEHDVELPLDMNVHYASQSQHYQSKIRLPGCDAGDDPLNCHRGIHMFYEDGQLLFSIDGHARALAPEPVGNKDFRPCVSIGYAGVQLRIAVDTPDSKRKGMGECPIAKVNRTLWDDKVFTDASVVCLSRTMPVHRCVLAAASPFFARAFASPMREGGEARVVLEDTDEASSEALLKYLYTSCVDDGVDTIALLPLAHRLGATSLVEHCATDIVRNLCPGNVVPSIVALRPFRDDGPTRKHWGALVDFVRGDRVLLQTLLIEGIHPLQTECAPLRRSSSCSGSDQSRSC